MYLLPSDLPGCSPAMSFSWITTERLGGYAERRFLMEIIGTYRRVFHWGSLAEVSGVHLHLGDRQEDRDEANEDMRTVPEEWRSQVHFRWAGWEGAVLATVEFLCRLFVISFLPCRKTCQLYIDRC